MFNLFSSFDLSIFVLEFYTLSLFIFVISMGVWKESVLSFSKSIYSNVVGSVSSSVKSNPSEVFLLMTSSVMVFFIFLNFMSVNSFNFPMGSQLSMVLFLGLTLWLCFNMFVLLNNVGGFLSHLIPEGSPSPLIPFLFVIELVSAIIRPLTVSVRMVANILAGHLLMILLSKMVFLSSYFFILYSGLNLVEMAVALIQSYIFVTMISLYYSECH